MDSDAGLPSNAQYESFCESRIREIRALDKHLGVCEHGQRAFQKLPRNMQRRNVSYNPQRLPRYLREKHKREVGYNIKINKRPSRRYRRRPANLLAEYNRRQKSQIWLETHIWHAKRFHMVRNWGYVLPRTTTFKSYRATIRAATESCLVQDVSYECCFEIEGPIYEIIKPFSNILPQNDMHMLKKDTFIDGKTTLETFIYKKDRYPFGAVGKATMICSSLPSQNLYHKLWIWVHPSIFENVLSILVELFDFKLIVDEKLSENDFLVPTGNVIDCVLSPKDTRVKKTPKYFSELAKLTILKDNLIKFRFIGPESYKLIKNVLIPSDIQPISATSGEKNCKNNSENDFEDKMDCTPEAEGNPQETTDNQEIMDNLEKVPWWISHFSNPDYVKNHKDQLSLWNSYSESRNVFSLVVRDVRAVLPWKKKPLNNEVPITNKNSDSSVENCEKYTAPIHPIFDAEIRTNVTQNMKSNHEMNKAREKRLVPGGSLPLMEEESRIPVLLMKRHGSHVSNIGSGWDIVLPSGWGSQLLVALSMNGAVIGGQDEEESFMREFLTPPPPHQLPDTEAGAMFAQEQKEEKENEYFRKPPNCRQNYNVLGVKFPFGIDWMELIQYWDNSCNEYFVVRNLDYLRYLSVKTCKKIDKLNQRSQKRNNYEDPEEKEEAAEHSAKKFAKESQTVSVIPTENYSFPDLIKNLKNSLIYVRLILLGKGSIEPYATICLPSEEDLERHIGDLNCTNIIEPIHEDKSAIQRMTLKVEHKKQLSQIRRKRKKARNVVLCEENPLVKYSSMQEALNAAVDVVNEENSEMLKRIKEYNKKYNDLWLYDTAKTFQSNSRKIFGFVMHGGFCLRLGGSGGLGYAVTEPLLELMAKYNVTEEHAKATTGASTQSQIRVLVRNPSSLQYKWARLVILNVC